MRYRKRESYCLLTVGILLLGVFSACNGLPKAKAYIECTSMVNNDLVLNVDFIWANATEENAILKIGPDGWRISEYSEGMTEPQLIRRSLRSGCAPEVISLVGREGDKSLIVFADYRGVDEDKYQQIVIPAGSTVRIVVGPDRIECVEGCVDY